MPQGDRLLYLEVLLPLPLDKPVYGYLTDEAAVPGQLCEVPFGNGKGTIRIGLIRSVSEAIPEASGKRIGFKRIHRILPFPPLAPEVVKTWVWASEYFMCGQGEVLGGALPPGLETFSGKGVVKTFWRFNPALLEAPAYQKEVIQGLGRKKTALAFLEKLVNGEVNRSLTAPTLTDFAQNTGLSDHTLSVLREAGAIEPFETTEDRFDPTALLSQSAQAPEPFEGWGDKEIMLSYHPSSRAEDRVPISWLRDLLASQGGQYLLLFPNLESLKLSEPALRETFGPGLFPYYHSASGAKIRERSFTAAIKGRPGIFYGLRQAVWLPFADLRAVAVTDEEDHGYRQFEPAPRFTASYLALMLAKAFGAKVLLTSASPSVETMLKGVLGRLYAFREVPGQTKDLPKKLTLVDMEQAFLRNEVSARMLSPTLSREIAVKAENGEKVLLIYQRQGFAKYISCGNCLEILKCPVCGTTLRYYGGSGRNLVCPACGHLEPRPGACPHCGADKLKAVGTGVERLREAVRSFFSFQEVFLSESGQAEELRPGVTLCADYEPALSLLRAADAVGVVQWDLFEFRPDFRAAERGYRFMVKLLSETRAEAPVIVQFFRPYGVAMKAILAEKYQILLDSELENRYMVGFSPFSRQIDVVIQSDSARDAYKTANLFIQKAGEALKEVRTLGPSPLNSSRRKAEIGYRVTFLVSLEASLKAVRDFLKSLRSSIFKAHRGSHLFIYFDVDPQ